MAFIVILMDLCKRILKISFLAMKENGKILKEMDEELCLNKMEKSILGIGETI